MFNLVVTNVPGPQVSLFADGALMLGAYPVVPLAKGQAVSLGVTSYNGGMYFGLNADREAMSDVDVLADCIDTAILELLETLPDSETSPTEAVTEAVTEAAGEAAEATEAAPAALAESPELVVDLHEPVEVSADADLRGGVLVKPRQVSSEASRGLVPRANPASRPVSDGRSD
jgi:hypothetical protein